MEVKLQEFVRQIETISSVRNSDPRNPVAVDMDIPGLSMRFRVVGSITEPTYQAYPINLIWVVLDADSLYYRKTLQLKSLTPNDPTVAGAVAGDFQGTWIEVTTYRDLFLYPQYYAIDTGAGEQGPPGPPGYNLRGQWVALETYAQWDSVYYDGSSYYSTTNANTGLIPGQSANWSLVAKEGDTPEVDYEYIIEEVIRRLKPVPVAVEIRNLPASVFGTKTATFRTYVKFDNGTEREVTNECVYVITPQSSGSIVTNATLGTFTAADIPNDVSTAIKAVFELEDGSTLEGSATINVQALKANLLTITGPATIPMGANQQYVATARFTDNSTRVVTADCTWSIAPNVGSFSQPGLLTPNATVTTATVLTATYNGAHSATVSDTHNVQITVPVVQAKARYGAGVRINDFSEYNQEFLETITSSELSTAGLEGTFDINMPTGSNLYGFFAHPKSWGKARFEDRNGPPGWYGGWDGVRNAPIDPTMREPYEVMATFNGVTEPWLLYRTDNRNLGQTSWNVSKTPGS